MKERMRRIKRGWMDGWRVYQPLHIFLSYLSFSVLVEKQFLVESGPHYFHRAFFLVLNCAH